MTERHAQILGRFAELGASLAEHLHDEVLAAESAQDKRDLALAFHRLTRSTRQTLALEARLKREAEAAVREAARAQVEAAEELRRAARAASAPRRRRIAAAVERLIWTEGRDEDHAAYLAGQLDELMDEDDLSGLYAEGAVEAHATRLAITLGLVRPGDEVLIFPTPEAAAAHAKGAGYGDAHIFDAAPIPHSSSP